jgi:hypothetical protein
VSQLSQSVFSGQAVDPVLAELIEEITDKLHKGEPVDLETYIQQHPKRAEELGKLLPALHMLAVAGSAGLRIDDRDSAAVLQEVFPETISAGLRG